MKRTTFASKFFAVFMSAALASFMFIPTAAWADPGTTGEDRTGFDYLPSDKLNNTDVPTNEADESSAETNEDGTSSEPATETPDQSNSEEGTDGSTDNSDVPSTTPVDEPTEETTNNEGDDATAEEGDEAQAEETIPWEGEGTAREPYLIEDEAGLQALADNVNGGETYEKNGYFKLNKSITLSSEWTPIGNGADTGGSDERVASCASNESKASFAAGTPFILQAMAKIRANTANFSGNFNGNGKTITGLKITATNESVGLFGVLGDKATVYDLTLSNVDINCPDAENAGALVGSINGAATIKNIKVASGSISADGNVGGIAGTTIGACELNSCINNATVESTSGNAGGILGFSDSAGAANIIYCENNAAVNAGTAAGGIVGNIESSATTAASVIGCRNGDKGTVEGETAGGIVGTTNNAVNITKNISTASTVKGGKNIGGVAGLIDASSSSNASKITVAYNYATTNVSKLYNTGTNAANANIHNNTKEPPVSYDSTLYATIEYAINVIESAGPTTTQLIQLRDTVTENVTIPAKCNIELDLNGNNIYQASSDAGAVVTVNGILTVKDSKSTVTVPAPFVNTEASSAGTIAGTGTTGASTSGTGINTTAGTGVNGTSSTSGLTTNTGTANTNTSGSSASIGTEAKSTQNPNTTGVIVNGTSALLTLTSGTIAGSTSAVTLQSGGNFTMSNTSTGILRSGSGGINVANASGAIEAASTDDSFLGGMFSFFGGLFGNSDEENATDSSESSSDDENSNGMSTYADQPKITVGSGLIYASPVINVSTGTTPAFDVTGGYYSTAMPADYAAQGYHPTLQINDTLAPYTVSNQDVTFKFASNDGTAVDDRTVPYGTTPADRTMPASTKDGYVLAGWYTSEAFEGNPTTELPEVATANTTYYAKWITPLEASGALSKAGDNAPLMILLSTAGIIGALIALGFGIRMLRRIDEE